MLVFRGVTQHRIYILSLCFLQIGFLQSHQKLPDGRKRWSTSSSGLWGGENSNSEWMHVTPVDAFDLMVCIYGCFRKKWYPQIIHFNGVFHYKPSILGYPYFRKHPYTVITICGLDHGGCLAINLSKKINFSLVEIYCAKNKTWQMAKGKNPPKPAAQFELKVSWEWFCLNKEQLKGWSCRFLNFSKNVT